MIRQKDRKADRQTPALREESWKCRDGDTKRTNEEGRRRRLKRERKRETRKSS